MLYTLLCLAAFACAYEVTLFYTSIFYHRAFTHRAIRLKPFVRRFAILTGNWVTCIDPLTWICMHRLHHQHSDTPKDPHSPQNSSMGNIIFAQLTSYERTLKGLRAHHPRYMRVVRDLDFPVCWSNRTGLWFFPHILHTVIAVSIALYFNANILAICYWLGVMSHPLQGWAVNALGHGLGYRNFNTNDRSTNNLLVAWLVMGEGFQNNHHQDARSAKFSVKWWEFDPGYGFCWVLRALGLIEIGPRKRPAPKLKAPVLLPMPA